MILRAIFGLLSLTAFGAVAASILFVVIGSVTATTGPVSASLGDRFELPSVMLGVGIGLLLGLAMRLQWSDLPRRLVTWVLIHERDFFNIALVAACIAILVLY